MNIETNTVKEYLEELGKSLTLEARAETADTRVVYRGQVYYCDLGIGIGHELKKKRPCVIVQDDKGNIHSGNTIVVPIASSGGHIPSICAKFKDKKNWKGEIILSGYANAAQIRTVSKARLGDFICELDEEDMYKIERCIKNSLDLF